MPGVNRPTRHFLRCARAAGVLTMLAVFVARAAGALTLAQAQQQALATNADLRVASAQAEAAAAQLRTSREFPNPVLGLATSKIATDGSSNGTVRGNRILDRSYDSIISLSQLFELGKRGPRQQSARAAQRAAEAQRDEARRLVLQAVSQTYVAALEAREESRVLAASAAALRREAGLANVRLAAGDLASNDQRQIELAASRLELDAAASRHTATAAVIALEILLGSPAPTGETELADTLDTLPLPLPSAEVAGDGVAGTRPDVAAAEANVAKAEADLVLQQRAPFPDLTVSAQFERNPPDQPNTAGLGVSFPLPLWNRNGGAVRAARAAREVAQAQLDKARHQAVAEVAGSRSAFREARARATAFVEQLRPQSAAVAKTVAYAYEHGGASLVELLAAERNDNEVRIAAARAQADAATAAFALSAALNRLAPVHP